MRVCVFGAGATGGHFAALLARAGAEVSVVARGAHLEAIRAKGLEVRTDEGTVVAAVQASDDAGALGPQDLVLVTLKSYALAPAAPAIARLLGPQTPALFLQNGVPWWYYHGVGGARDGQRLPAIDPGDALWNAVGPHRVLGGITSSACTVVAPGVIEVKGGNRPLTLGEPDGSDSPRLQAAARLLRAAGFPVDTTSAIRDAIWTKLALNLGSGPAAVLAPLPLRELLAMPSLVDARLRIHAEVSAIAEALGCRITQDLAALMGQVRQSAHVPSIGQDSAAGRRLELQSMFIEPLRMGHEAGVSAPTLELFVDLCVLRARAAGQYP